MRYFEANSFIKVPTVQSAKHCNKPQVTKKRFTVKSKIETYLSIR